MLGAVDRLLLLLAMKICWWSGVSFDAEPHTCCQVLEGHDCKLALLQDNVTQPPTAYGGPFNVLNQPSDSGTTHMSIVDGTAYCSSPSPSCMLRPTWCTCLCLCPQSLIAGAAVLQILLLLGLAVTGFLTGKPCSVILVILCTAAMVSCAVLCV